MSDPTCPYLGTASNLDLVTRPWEKEVQDKHERTDEKSALPEGFFDDPAVDAKVCCA